LVTRRAGFISGIRRQALSNNAGPVSIPGPFRLNSERSALGERAALCLALRFRGHREALGLAGVQALAGVRAALAGALALAGVDAHALALGGGVCARRSGRYDRAGEKQGGGSGRKRRAGLGIQLHDDLLDDCVTTNVTP